MCFIEKTLVPEMNDYFIIYFILETMNNIFILNFENCKEIQREPIADTKGPEKRIN